MFLVQSNGSMPPCPLCEGKLSYRDSVRRILRKEGGCKETILIRRLRCQCCNALHRELPDCVLPFKQYEAEVISGVLDQVVTPDDTDSEDYPCIETMRLWLRWFQINLANIEGALRRAGYWLAARFEDLLSSNESLLEAIRSRYSNWLEIMIKIIYNSGNSIPPLRFP